MQYDQDGNFTSKYLNGLTFGKVYDFNMKSRKQNNQKKKRFIIETLHSFTDEFKMMQQIVRNDYDFI